MSDNHIILSIDYYVPNEKEKRGEVQLAISQENHDVLLEKLKKVHYIFSLKDIYGIPGIKLSVKVPDNAKFAFDVAKNIRTIKPIKPLEGRGWKDIADFDKRTKADPQRLNIAFGGDHQIYPGKPTDPLDTLGEMLVGFLPNSKKVLEETKKDKLEEIEQSIIAHLKGASDYAKASYSVWRNIFKIAKKSQNTNDALRISIYHKCIEFIKKREEDQTLVKDILKIASVADNMCSLAGGFNPRTKKILQLGLFCKKQVSRQQQKKIDEYYGMLFTTLADIHSGVDTRGMNLKAQANEAKLLGQLLGEHYDNFKKLTGSSVNNNSRNSFSSNDKRRSRLCHMPFHSGFRKMRKHKKQGFTSVPTDPGNDLQ